MNALRRIFSRRPREETGSPTDLPAVPEDLQRGDAAVSQTTTAQGRLQRTTAMLTIGGIGIGLLTWYYTTAYSKVEAARTASQRTTVAKADADSTLPPIDFNKVRPPETPPVTEEDPASPYRIGSILGAETSHVPDTLAPTGGRAPATPTAYGIPHSKGPEQLREERLLAGDVFTRSTTMKRVPDSEPNTLDETDALPFEAPAATHTDTASPLASLLQSTPPQLARASVLPTQRLLLPKGAFVDCTLETAINSSLPGMTTCLTAVDTLSADGSVVLLERGTKLIGETRGEVAHGTSRLFVLWTEARTPQGVIVPLASPGTDELGRSGLPGKVDRHFVERFGAAILVSVIDGAIQAAVANQSGPGSTVVSTGTSQDIMTEVLKSTINIPPTVTKQQGDRIQILVARDLDFRSVYTLASRQR